MKIQSPWMGRVKGSAGNMTGSKVYDKNVLRAKAFEVSNPNTTAQQTERSFFAQVAECCASVSEEQLRSLFGVKPKGMSRRNALTKQVSKAFSIDGTSKTLDFSQLLSIGNGAKVKTNIFHFEQVNQNSEIEWTIDQLGDNVNSDSTIIFVIFDKTKNKIYIENWGTPAEDLIINLDDAEAPWFNDEIYCYPTIETNGMDTENVPYGSFTIKTRATD